MLFFFVLALLWSQLHASQRLYLESFERSILSFVFCVLSFHISYSVITYQSYIMHLALVSWTTGLLFLCVLGSMQANDKLKSLYDLLLLYSAWTYFACEKNILILCLWNSWWRPFPFQVMLPLIHFCFRVSIFRWESVFISLIA